MIQLLKTRMQKPKIWLEDLSRILQNTKETKLARPLLQPVLSYKNRFCYRVRKDPHPIFSENG